MSRHAFIALGSNLGKSKAILSRILRPVAQACGGKIVSCSGLYASKAELLTDQPPFLNAVVEVQLGEEQSNSPEELLRRLKSVEGKFAKSSVRYGPREVDLDIIAFDDGQRFSSDILTVPHPRACERDFVVRPLCDLQRGSGVILGKHGEQAIRYLAPSKSQTAFPVQKSVWAPKRHAVDMVAHGEDDQRSPLVMGILNVTPDSFSDGGLYTDLDASVAQALKMSTEGADVIDIGGESTRPNAAPVSLEEELERVLPVIERLTRREDFTSSISVDTRKPEVARAAIQAGAQIINDEVGEDDDSSLSMVHCAGEMGVPIITMHTRGDARSMESLIMPDDASAMEHVIEWLDNRAKLLVQHNVPSWNIMVDPGLGFAKSHQQNIDILAQLDRFTKRRYPVLIGASRKRFLRNLMHFDADVATHASTVIAVLAGAAMVRVHDVRGAVDAVAVANAVRVNRFQASPLN
mmetsp:Transcript_1845/g.2949  ORF Transcript_1845/g.2949 Transcript_1845/m.2949 type:complete len:464 (-) Transcript_1845:29-1420(-)